MLVAEGLSSREIGGRLCLSARTVDHHVQSLLLKTGTRNRAALAGRLAEWGLAGSAEAARATAGR